MAKTQPMWIVLIMMGILMGHHGATAATTVESCMNQPPPPELANFDCNQLSTNMGNSTSQMVNCACEVYLDTVKQVAGAVLCMVQRMAASMAPQNPQSGQPNCTQTADGVMSCTATSSSVSPVGMMNFPPEVMQMVKDITSLLIDTVMDAVCAKTAEFQDCLNTKFLTSNMPIDVMIKKFVDGTKVGQALGIMCSTKNDMKDNLDCIVQATPATGMCSVFGNIGGSLTNVDVTSDMFVTKLCPLVVDMSNCMSLPLSKCSKSLGEKMKSMYTTLMSQQCLNAANNPVTPNIMASYTLFCATSAAKPVMEEINKNMGSQAGQPAIGSMLTSIMNKLCEGTLVDDYFSCLQENVGSSTYTIDKLVNAMVSVSQLSKNGALKKIACSPEVKKSVSEIPTCQQLQTVPKCATPANLGPWNATFGTPNGLAKMPQTAQGIRAKYCSATEGLVKCSVGVFEQCDNYLSDQMLQAYLWIMQPDCGGKPRESTFQNIVGDDNGSSAFVASTTLLSMALLFFKYFI